MHDAICINDLNNIALQIEDVIIGARNTPVDRIVKCKRSAGFVIEEIQSFRFQNRSADTLPDRFPCNFSVLREIVMRHGLGRGKRPVGLGQILLLDIRLFRRGRVRLDRLPRLLRRFGVDCARQDGVDDPDRHIIRADDLVACNALRVLTPRTGEAGFRGNIRIIQIVQPVAVIDLHGLYKRLVGIEPDKQRQHFPVSRLHRHIACNRCGVFLPCAFIA